MKHMCPCSTPSLVVLKQQTILLLFWRQIVVIFLIRQLFVLDALIKYLLFLLPIKMQLKKYFVFIYCPMKFIPNIMLLYIFRLTETENRVEIKRAKRFDINLRKILN